MVFRVTVERDGRFWFVDVHGVGATQARHLREVDHMARDLIAEVRQRAPGTIDLDVTIQVPEDVREHLARIEGLRSEAARANHQATEELRELARALSAEGLPLRDVGQLLDLSHQRVHQLLKS